MRREEVNSLFGVTDRQLDSMAEEYEQGTWKGRVGAIRPGRPRVFDEELETISFRIPKSRVKEIDRNARERGESRSQFLRRTIDQALPA
ncbi:ribbon-helix-helix protein, CopG family [Bifidobacterium mongoliense]|uniref:Toxin-antitoxin system antitoxin subunit n=1 Tax=Bifidobacterium mongoliense TaxID=518643 RepID=A0A423UBZ4_9BIFI|nr:ribbon-helix-helix protein, CopG family [Bifidobacterium mongoliense]ROT86225.1 toxin-antitoxin system antitoxin subunit [Bifidobacterium mongoliense]